MNMGHIPQKVTLAPNERVFIIGHALLSVDHGAATCFGYKLEANNKEYYIASVPSSGLLGIENPSESESVQLSLRPVFTGLEDLVLRNGSFYLGDDFRRGASFRIEPYSSPYPKICIPDSWLFSVGDLRMKRSYIICGPRKVGKSTFSRYLVNSCLNFHRQVAYLDLDCGQSEFAPSGCLSLKIVENPLFCQPSCHVGDADASCFVGFMSVSLGLTSYLSAASSLFDLYKAKYSTIPLVINTIGWVSGIGFSILQNIVQAFHPDKVFTIKEHNQNESSNGYILDALFQECELPILNCKTYHKYEEIDVSEVESPNVARSEFRIEPGELRDISTRCYFFRSFDDERVPRFSFENFSATTSLQAPLDRLSFFSSDLRRIEDFKEIIPFLNLSLVALTTTSLDSSTVPSKIILGLAIIRSFDPRTKTISIITPLNLQKLNKQPCIGIIFEPSFILSRSLILQESAGFDDFPYVSKNQIAGILKRRKSRIIRRKYLSN